MSVKKATLIVDYDDYTVEYELDHCDIKMYQDLPPGASFLQPDDLSRYVPIETTIIGTSIQAPVCKPKTTKEE